MDKVIEQRCIVYCSLYNKIYHQGRDIGQAVVVAENVGNQNRVHIGLHVFNKYESGDIVVQETNFSSNGWSQTRGICLKRTELEILVRDLM